MAEVWRHVAMVWRHVPMAMVWRHVAEAWCWTGGDVRASRGET